MRVSRKDIPVGSMYGLRLMDTEGQWAAYVLYNWPGCPVSMCMPGAVQGTTDPQRSDGMHIHFDYIQPAQELLALRQ